MEVCSFEMALFFGAVSSSYSAQYELSGVKFPFFPLKTSTWRFLVVFFSFFFFRFSCIDQPNIMASALRRRRASMFEGSASCRTVWFR